MTNTKNVIDDNLTLDETKNEALNSFSAPVVKTKSNWRTVLIVFLLLFVLSFIGSRIYFQHIYTSKITKNEEFNLQQENSLISDSDVVTPSSSPNEKPSSFRNSSQPITPSPTALPTPTLVQPKYGVAEIQMYRDDGKVVMFSSIQLYYPDKSVKTFYPDNNGYIKISNLPSGVYHMTVHYSTNTTEKDFTIVDSETVSLKVTVIPPAPTATPTPTPDTQPPVLDAINGPYDWGQNGTCFIINGDQVHDNQSAYTFSLSWALDGNWSDWKENEATKCYTSLSSGNHTIASKVKDLAGNISNEVTKIFTQQ